MIALTRQEVQRLLDYSAQLTRVPAMVARRQRAFISTGPPGDAANRPAPADEER
jgi:hypothetical protein